MLCTFLELVSSFNYIHFVCERNLFRLQSYSYPVQVEDTARIKLGL